MEFGHEPLKRAPVVLQMDADERPVRPVLTDRSGVAVFDLPPPGSGKGWSRALNASTDGWMVKSLSISGRLLNHRRLYGRPGFSPAATPVRGWRRKPFGSTDAMRQRTARVSRRSCQLTEAFAKTLALREGLDLTPHIGRSSVFSESNMPATDHRPVCAIWFVTTARCGMLSVGPTAVCIDCFPAVARRSKAIAWRGCCALGRALNARAWLAQV